jgi:uncharacterized protein YaaW (UPF0174 family)
MANAIYSTTRIGLEPLKKAAPDELLAITQLFVAEAKSPKLPEELMASICSAGGHSVANWLRSQGVPYSEVLHDVAKALKVADIHPLANILETGLTITEMDTRALNDSVSAQVSRSWLPLLNSYCLELERKIISQFTLDTYNRLTPEQRAEVDTRMAEIAKKKSTSSAKGLTTAAALLAAAGTSGFAPYMLLSTVISTTTFGTAGFGVYTAASSMLHVFLGPPGWAALGVAAIYKLGGPNQILCLKAVLAISMLRNRLSGESVRQLQ